MVSPEITQYYEEGPLATGPSQLEFEHTKEILLRQSAHLLAVGFKM